MKLALINEPNVPQKFSDRDVVKDIKKTVLKNVSITNIDPPLSLMYISSFLNKFQYKNKIIDINAENISNKKILDKIIKYQPDVGIFIVDLFTPTITLKWIKYLKEKLGLTIIVLSDITNPWNDALVNYPKAVISNDFIDYGIIGSFRKSLPELLEFLKGHRDNIKDIEGILSKDKEGIFVNYPEKKYENLNELPWPNRKDLDNTKYQAFFSKSKSLTSIYTSLGCPFSCTFCNIGANEVDCFYQRDIEDVVKEIEYCVKNQGIKSIKFYDRDFLINKKRSKKICEEILKRNIDFEWSCMTRIDRLDKNTLKLLKKSGCQLIWFGIESGNEEMLENLEKEITLDQYEAGLKKVREFGIKTGGFFIIGSPGETEKEVKETINFAKDLALDYAEFSKMMDRPGTELYEETKKYLGYDYFEKLLKGEKPDRKLPLPWTDLTNEEIDYWIKKAFYEFYLRPSYALNKLRNIDNVTKFLRYAKIGFNALQIKNI
ncbi:MAG: radical SAM protein [Candidatus Aenigmatarchaeota archaeon]